MKSIFYSSSTMNTHLFYAILFCLFAVFPASASNDEGWILSASSRENYNGVTLANGRIGLVSSPLFDVADIVLNGVYDKEDKEGVSRIVRGPVFTHLQLSLDGEPVSERHITGWHQNLNMQEAYLETIVETPKATLTYSIRALRNLPYMGMVVVEVTPNAPVKLEVVNSAVFPEELTHTSATYKLFKDGEIELPVYTSQARSRTGMQDLATCSAFLFDDERPAIEAHYGTAHHQAMGFEKPLQKGQSYRFALAGAICSSRDFSDPKSEAERMAVFALQSDIDYFLAGHKAAWARLWQSDIVLEGDDEAQRDIRLALYNLYASAGENTRLSIPPMGLSTVTGYNGHVFWDAELWMYPPLLMLNGEMARSCVDYRYDRLPKARQKAAQYGFGGCMYPWESDDSGEEATPTWCLTGTFEHHVTADVGIAFWNYYCVTKDKHWLKTEGYPVLKEVADFWASRVVRNPDGSYSIQNVVGANEFAPNVNDNAFTNGSAKYVLECAAKAAGIVGEQAMPAWQEIAGKLRFHYMADGVMKENETYAGEIIKQADVNLLSYPLDMLADKENMQKNLDYYAGKIHEDGPAMGNAILAILYAKLGNRDEAYKFFKKSYLPNKRPPFGVLSESAFSDNPYFCTGAGGLLQVLLSGFGGLKITDGGIVQEGAILPAAWKSLTLKGIGPDKKTYVVR